LSFIPKGILEQIRKLSIKFLWNGRDDTNSFHWVALPKIGLLKEMWGWGPKNIHYFAKALVSKGVWRILKGESLWVKLVSRKYIKPLSIVEWFSSRDKSCGNASIIWKFVIKSFSLIGDWLVWRVGRGDNIRIGEDPWVGCEGKHRIPPPLVLSLRELGYFSLT